ncbi:hypothetical protein AB0N05_20165 [Nocardia sp. NPDC051030]|uniref:hypothetical protein n=1 Tax=Nocardia sp. NPDC051030 TaxID=3155162 RepID=UPI00341B5769
MHRRTGDRRHSRLRGCLAGVTLAVLAVGAHGAAGGGIPGSSGLTLLLVVAAAIGAVAATLRSPVTLPALMAVGQPACHIALSGLAQHGHSAARDFVADGVMATAHTVATLVFAFLILVAERLYELVSQTIRALVAPPTGLPVRTGGGRWTRFVATAPELLTAGALGARAPPVAA